MELKNGKLRSLDENDLDILLKWRNSERVNRSMFSDHIISEQEHRKWFRQLDSEENVYLVFELSDRPIGMVNFTDIDRYNIKCEWGFYLGETGLPRGTGTLMGYLGLEYAFNNLKIRKLCSEAFTFNSDSIRYHKKLGFVEEGLLRRHIMKDGRYEDVVIMALFSEIWQGCKRGIIKNILDY